MSYVRYSLRTAQQADGNSDELAVDHETDSNNDECFDVKHDHLYINGSEYRLNDPKVERFLSALGVKPKFFTQIRLDRLQAYCNYFRCADGSERSVGGPHDSARSNLDSARSLAGEMNIIFDEARADPNRNPSIRAQISHDYQSRMAEVDTYVVQYQHREISIENADRRITEALEEARRDAQAAGIPFDETRAQRDEILEIHNNNRADIDRWMTSVRNQFDQQDPNFLIIDMGLSVAQDFANSRNLRLEDIQSYRDIINGARYLARRRYPEDCNRVLSLAAAGRVPEMMDLLHVMQLATARLAGEDFSSWFTQPDVSRRVQQAHLHYFQQLLAQLPRHAEEVIRLIHQGLDFESSATKLFVHVNNISDEATASRQNFSMEPVQNPEARRAFIAIAYAYLRRSENESIDSSSRRLFLPSALLAARRGGITLSPRRVSRVRLQIHLPTE